MAFRTWFKLSYVKLREHQRVIGYHSGSLGLLPVNPLILFYKPPRA
jgi:hypothetical protein